MDLVQERTNITINEQGGGALGGPDEMLSLVQNQTAEVVTIAPADYGSRLAMSNVFNLPGTYDDRVEAEKRCWELVRGVLYEEEWSELGLEPLTSQAMGPYHAESADGRIEELSDWEGRAVRSPGGIMSSTIEALGGSPTEIAHNQADAFSRGIIDTNIHPPHASVANDLVQFFDAAETSVHLGAFSQFLVMNQDVFNSLEQEVQDTLLEIGQELTEITPQREMEMVDEAYQAFEDQGVELYEVSEENASEWEETLLPVKENFLQDLKDEGLPAEEVMETWDKQYPY
jgi:TRAP-type C4-dicarboxylate transport system substrate-binding protein